MSAKLPDWVLDAFPSMHPHPDLCDGCGTAVEAFLRWQTVDGRRGHRFCVERSEWITPQLERP